MAKIPSISGVADALADAPATLEPRAWIGLPMVTEEKRDPVTGAVQMWNGRPVLQGRRLTVEEWEGMMRPQAQQEQLMQTVRNPEDKS